MADLGGVTPPWTNDRFARKQSILQNSMANPFCMTMKTFPSSKHHRITKQQGLSFKGNLRWYRDRDVTIPVLQCLGPPYYVPIPQTNGTPSFNPLPALEILRCTLQRRINKDIQKVFQYYAQFFQMAVDNMRDSFGQNAVTEDHLMMVFRNSLEAAKEIFTSQPRRTRNVHKQSHEKFHAEKYPESHHAPEKGWEWQESEGGPPGKRQKLENDNDNEAAVFSMRPASAIQTRKRKQKIPAHYSDYTQDISTSTESGKVKTKVKLESVKREGPKWDPDRITEDSQFVMGARANKALGLGATRGRIYIKHPEMFKYSADQDDKQWLFDNHMMPATGGKAYLLLLEDVIEISQTEEYKDSANLNDMRAFRIPDFMRDKVRRYMENHRTDKEDSKQTPSEYSSDTEENS